MLQLNPTIAVHTPLGDGDVFFIIDYGINVNSVWVVRFKGGVVKHLYSDDIRIYGNPMDGAGWDTEQFGTIKKLPAGARRSIKFLNKKSQ
jgi:hypothetical protein